MLIATTVRRLISRFLSGKRGENEVKEDENLLYFLQAKEEFWTKDLFNNNKFDEEFENMIYSFTVNVNQAIKFYEILGGDKELLGDKKEFEEVKENENENNEINNEVGDFEKDPIVEKTIKQRKNKKKLIY